MDLLWLERQSIDSFNEIGAGLRDRWLMGWSIMKKMAPILDSDRYLIIKEVAKETNRQVGFIVKFPWGMTTGPYGQISGSGHEAMSRQAAEALIAKKAAEMGIGDEGFTLLPIAAMFVK